jgi:hypothetical protein
MGSAAQVNLIGIDIKGTFSVKMRERFES